MSILTTQLLIARPLVPGFCTRTSLRTGRVKRDRGGSLVAATTSDARPRAHPAGINERVRPFHDLRHTAITNDAAINTPIAVMKRAGHSNFKTTDTYIDLAGEAFREEAQKLDHRLFGALRDADNDAA